MKTQFCIVGATRGTGLLITQRLLQAGASVRVVARDPERARWLLVFLMFVTLAKQEAARIIGADKGRIKGCKSVREDDRALHTVCTPVRASLTNNRNDSRMPDPAKKPAATKTSADRKPATKAAAPTTTASTVTKAMLAKVGRAFKKADMTNVSEQKKLEFTQELLAAGVPILNRSSTRISRAIKGEISIEDLKVSHRATG